MHNLLCAAFARLVRCKFFYIGLGAMVLMELYTMLTERYGIQQFGDGLEKAFFQYPMAGTLIVPAFCGLFVGEEYSGGTLRNKIIAGVSRSRIYLANLLLCMFAALCFTFAAMLTGLVVGLPIVGGFQMEPGEVVAYAVCSLGVALSTAAIATLLTMLIPHRAVGLVVSILLAFGLLFFGQHLFQALGQPAYTLPTERIVKNGQVFYQVNYGADEVPNPEYPRGALRTAYRLLQAALPYGQCFKVAFLQLGSVWMMLGGTALCVLLSTGAGLLLFRRRDVR
ncbi:MAG: ABC transporter permease subunit [Acutalibacteraceae bacterium]|jgi:ABC-2 type transport system permease protein